MMSVRPSMRPTGRSPAPTTAGTPMARARMARCEDREPRADTTPTKRSRGTSASMVAVQSEIQILGERLSAHISIEEQALFDAYALMLSSERLVEKVVSRILAGN